MRLTDEHQPAEGYELAVRCYIQEHQACAHCREQYCVLRSEWGSRIEYHCAACDFSVCHDRDSGHYFMDLGDGVGLAVPLRHELIDVDEI